MIDSFWVGYIVVGVVTVLPSSNLVLDEIRLERDFSVQCDRRASEQELNRHFDEIPRKTIFVDRSVEGKITSTLIMKLKMARFCQACPKEFQLKNHTNSHSCFVTSCSAFERGNNDAAYRTKGPSNDRT